MLRLLNIDGGSPKLDVDINYNPFNCDCKDFSIISMNEHFTYSHAFDRANCEQPWNLYRQKVQYLSSVQKIT